MNIHQSLYGWIKCVCGFSKVEKPVLTLEQYLKGRDKTYPDDFNQTIVDNATVTIEKINALLLELRVKEANFSSGWRPKSYNNRIPNAAKSSKHITGEAGDLADADGKLKGLIASNLPLLERFGLYMESPESTPTWVHLQTVSPRSGNRVFKP